MKVFETQEEAIAQAMRIGGNEYQFKYDGCSTSNKDITIYKSDRSVLLKMVDGRCATFALVQPKKPKSLYYVDMGRGNDESGLQKYCCQEKYLIEESYWHINYGGGGETYIVYDRQKIKEYIDELHKYEEKIEEMVNVFSVCVKPPYMKLMCKLFG